MDINKRVVGMARVVGTSAGTRLKTLATAHSRIGAGPDDCNSEEHEQCLCNSMYGRSEDTRRARYVLLPESAMPAVYCAFNEAATLK